MKLKLLTAIALGAMAIISCDEDTATIGDSLTEVSNKLSVTTQTFDVLTQSQAVESVFSRDRQCFFGKVRDPETDTYVKSEFTTQFNMMENTVNDLPARSDFLSLNDEGQIIADSCVLFIQFDASSYYGDTLAPMKLRISELDQPITDARMHYTNYDPKAAGLVRQGGLKKDAMYTITDLTMRDTTYTYKWARVRLDDPYTDKNGVLYKEGYGAYLLRSFYDHPEYFKNSYAFINNVCPGFLFELADGIGVMAKIAQIDMYTYYHFNQDGTTLYSYLRTTSTEEVVQTTKITNDTEGIKELVAEDNCTFLKSPAGIFTEVTLPVDEICTSHPNDSLLSAKVIFNRINNQKDQSALALSAPQKLLLLEKDSLDSFFKGNNLYNNTYAYEVSLASNAYSFNNISNMLTRMYNAKIDGLKSDPNWVANHPNWNKALLIPVEEVTISSTSSSYYYGTTTTETPVSVKNSMSLSSTRLVKGSAANPIKMEVIYAKFRN